MITEISIHDMKVIKNWRSARVRTSDRIKALPSLREMLFQKQLDFIDDQSRQKALVAGRRAGKTFCDCIHLQIESESGNEKRCGYVAKTLKEAKRLMWRPLTKMVRERHGDGAVINAQDYSIEYPNGSIIQLAGAENEAQADGLRGWPYNLVILDEVEEFRDEVLEYLLNDVLKASLADYRGRLALTGTPNPACAGYLWDVDQGDKKEAWSRHHWTMFENERFPQWNGLPDWQEKAKAFLVEELKDLHLDINDPFIQREYFGRWIRSADAFILHPSDEINLWSGDIPPGLSNVLSIDLGFRDESAFAITGYSRRTGEVREIYEVSNSAMPMGEIIEIAKGLIRQFVPVKVVVDPASGGSNLVEELRRRYGIPIECADKANKAAAYRLWDADIRCGNYLFRADGKMIEQARKIQWDKNFKREREGIPCDLTDVGVYGHKECRHFIRDYPKPTPRIEDILNPPDDDDFEEPNTRRMPRRY